MALKKKITFEGNTYNVGNKERVSAAVALSGGYGKAAAIGNSGAHIKSTAGTNYGGSDLIVGKKGSTANTADPFTESATALFPLGTKLQYGDRTFRYASAGEAITAGLLCEGAALSHANHRDVAVQAAAAKGATTINLTISTTAVTANQFDEGYLHVNDVAGQGQLLKIKSHGTGTGTVAFVTYDPVFTALTTSSKVDLVLAPYSGALIANTTGVNATLGVTTIDTQANYFFWMQTGGPASVLVADAVAVLGQPLVRNVGTTGAARAIDSDADTLNGIIGTAMLTNGTGDNAMVWLNLDPG